MSPLLEPKMWFLVLAVSALGIIAPLTAYAIGKRGTQAVLSHFPRISKEQWEKASKLYEDYGSRLVFLSAIPMIGMVFSAVAGAFGIKLSTFVIWVFAGRLVRNWLILLLFDQALRAFFGPTALFRG